jgi:hypothetical protein
LFDQHFAEIEAPPAELNAGYGGRGAASDVIVFIRNLSLPNP